MTFLAASVSWGTIGPPKLLGEKPQCTSMLVDVPFRFILHFVMYYTKEKFTKETYLRGLYSIISI